VLTFHLNNQKNKKASIDPIAPAVKLIPGLGFCNGKENDQALKYLTVGLMTLNGNRR